MISLTFRELAEANLERLPRFKNSKGELAHTEPDGSDWSLADWLGAVLGELGEYANFAKKYRRGDITWEEFQKLGGKELADTVTYISILAIRLELDLGNEIAIKFNEVSERVGCPDIKLPVIPPPLECHDCSGRGWVLLDMMGDQGRVVCDVCKGEGVLPF